MNDILLLPPGSQRIGLNRQSKKLYEEPKEPLINTVNFFICQAINPNI